ncbi:MAG: DUF1156 domain-containing protein, partial [Thermofilum sp.]
MNSLLESNNFPIEEVNIASAKEKGPGRPPFWEMVFWWTRKPLASARAVILASLLGEGFDPTRFLRIAYPSYEGRGRFSKTPHYLNPSVHLLDENVQERIRSASLLDPFAGFGSIPLEAVRIGVGRVVASELLPSAVVFLRAVLEYPKWASDEGLGDQLVKDVEEWGKRVVEELRNDPDLKELYDGETAVYIGSWEVKCPYCGRYTPLIGNWWLARVKGEKGFKALAWMTSEKGSDGVEIRVVDLTGSEDLSKAEPITRGNKTVGVRVNGREYRVGDPALNGEPNINARNQDAACLYCHARLKGNGGKWIVKESLKTWNQNLEKYLKGEATLDELKNSPARPRILVKVKAKATSENLAFEPATQQDSEKLWRALEKLKQMWGDPDIPSEPLPHYDQEFARTHLWGFDKWFKLFNPRQLLTLVKLVKLIREAGRRVEEERLKQGWDKQKAHKYAEAVTTYLAIALCKYADFNSMTTRWNPGWLKFEESLSVRGIAMMWSWTDAQSEGEFTGTFKRNLENTIESLRYLINAVSGSPSRVEVVLDDATVLGRLGDERFDLIVTDPPYRDDVAYAELSDFYYVWLKRALSDNDGAVLAPRFHGDLFFSNGVEVPTQWQWFASREVSLSQGRCQHFGQASSPEDCERVFRHLLTASFKSMTSKLKDNGLIVTYFAQSSPDAWASLIDAGLDNGVYPSNAFPVLTESEESVVARGKAAISASIVVSWRRAEGGEPLDLSARYDELVEAASQGLRRIEEALAKAGNGVATEIHGVTVYVMSYAYVLSLLTRRGKPVRNGRPLASEEIVKLAAEILSQAYARATGAKLTSGDSIFYFVVKKVFPRSPQGRRLASSSDLILLSYGLRGESSTLKALDDFARRMVIKAYGREDETEVASRKTYILIEPVKANDELELSEVLRQHGVDADNPSSFKSPVHVVHALMLYSLKPKDLFAKYYEKLYTANPGLVAEAVELAKALATLEGDPEAELA